MSPPTQPVNGPQGADLPNSPQSQFTLDEFLNDFEYGDDDQSEVVTEQAYVNGANIGSVVNMVRCIADYFELTLG